MKLKRILLAACLSILGVGVNAAELKTIDQALNYNLAFSSGFATGTIFNITGVGRSWAIYTVGPSSATVEIGVTTITYSGNPNYATSGMSPGYSTSTFVVPGNSFLADDMVFNAINPTVGIQALGGGTTYFLYTTYGVPKNRLAIDSVIRP